jgi:hypothetical protein
MRPRPPTRQLDAAGLPTAPQIAAAIFASVLAFAPLSAQAVSLDAPAMVRTTEAFGALKRLQGDWRIQSQGKTLSILMSYDLGSKDSIVTERFGRELSVFYQAGDRLMMTHFCNAGNQPRLQLAPSNDPKVLDFELVDITNLTRPTDPHVHRIVYRLVDDHTLILNIVWTRPNGEETESYVLHRI